MVLLVVHMAQPITIACVNGNGKDLCNMPVMELTLQTAYAGQLCINRWNYIASGTPASVSLSFALISAIGAIFDTTALPPAYPPGTLLRRITNQLSVGLTLEQVTALNVYSATDFYQTPFVQPYTGAQVGEGQSPAVAFGFRTNLVRRDVARGTKRFPGVPETLVASLGNLTVDGQGAVADIADAMTDVLTYDDEGNTLTFTPAVCGKEEYDPNPTSPAANHRAYRYYATEAAQLAHTAVGVLWEGYDTVRTQVSRQYGRGR